MNKNEDMNVNKELKWQMIDYTEWDGLEYDSQ